MDAYADDNDRGVTLNYNTPKEQQQKYTCINENLIQENRKLLKEARDKSRAKKYKYKACTINGLVYVCKTDIRDVIYITFVRFK